MKKLLSLLLVLVLTLTSVVGCAKPQENASASKSEPAKEEKLKDVELTFAIWDKNQKSGMEDIAAAFTEKHPNIKINVEVTPWSEYWTKLEAGALGNTMPDIFWMHTNEFFKYANNGALMPIEDNMLDKSKYPQGLIDGFSLKGTLYGMPKDFDTIGLFYNKEIFDNVGVPYPDDTWDWDKLLEVAKKLTDKEKGIYGFASIVSNQDGYYNFVFQNDGFVLDKENMVSGFDNPATIEGVKYYFDMINEHGVSPTAQYIAENGKNESFTSGKVAMLLRGSWMMNSYMKDDLIKDKFDLAILPKGKKRASIYNGLVYASSAKTEYPQEVKMFLEFAGSKEANIIQGKSGAAIPAYEGTQKYWIEKFDRYNVEAFVEMLDYGIHFPYSKTAPKWNEIAKTTMNAIATGEISAEEGCKFIAEEMNKLLESE